MTILKKALASAAGAIASYYIAKLVTEALEEKPLGARLNDVKERAHDLKLQARGKVGEMKSKVKSKYDDLIHDDRDRNGL